MSSEDLAKANQLRDMMLDLSEHSVFLSLYFFTLSWWTVVLRNCENSESSFLPYSSLLPTESQSSPALPFLQVCRIALQQFDKPFVIFGWLMSLYLS